MSTIMLCTAERHGGEELGSRGCVRLCVGVWEVQRGVRGGAGVDGRRIEGSDVGGGAACRFYG